MQTLKNVPTPDGTSATFDVPDDTFGLLAWHGAKQLVGDAFNSAVAKARPDSLPAKKFPLDMLQKSYPNIYDTMIAAGVAAAAAKRDDLISGTWRPGDRADGVSALDTEARLILVAAILKSGRTDVPLKRAAPTKDGKSYMKDIPFTELAESYAKAADKDTAAIIATCRTRAQAVIDARNAAAAIDDL